MCGVRASVVLGLAVAIALGLVSGPSAAPPRESEDLGAGACDGYPEKRVYLENQSWWEPQQGPPGHVANGKQGHIHVGACFPLHQRVSGSLTLDLQLHLHNIAGQNGHLRVDVSYLHKHDFEFEWSCPVSDCSRVARVTVPLDEVPVSGLQRVNVFLNVSYADGTRQRNVTQWFVDVDNGKPRAELERRQITGSSWFTSVGGSKYARAEIAEADFPWNAATGELVPLSGTWRPRVSFDKAEGLVLVDPALHADPPSRGLVAYEGPGGKQTVSIDTTTLRDGQHRMLLVNCDPRPAGRHCGVLVVPFLVRNGTGETAAPAPPPASHTAHNAASAPAALSASAPRIARPRGRLTASMPVALASGLPVASGTVACAASTRGRSLRLVSSQVSRGVARCTWRLGSGHHLVRGSLTVRAGALTVRRRFAAHVR